METIDFINAQNVAIAYHKAGLGRRIAALLIDWLVMIVYVFSLLLLMDYFSDALSGKDWFVITALVLVLVPIVFYHVILETVFGGQTPGKMLLGIKVTRIDGSPAQLGNFCLRWLLLPIDLTFYGLVGIVSILVSKREQRLGDLAAGTVVVRVRVTSKIELYDYYYTFPERYRVTYKEVILLSEAQIAFIINLLIEAVNRTSLDKDLINVAYRVHSILNVPPRAYATPDEEKTFLRTVALDYNYTMLNGTQVL
jgi:uncharacterized RDD family membrane protein YckC